MLDIELKLSSLFSSFQTCYDFRHLREWFKLDEIFNVDIKETFQLIGFTHKTIHEIH